MRVRSVLSAPVRGLKRLTSIIFANAPMLWYGIPGIGRSYASEVGDGTSSSTVMAPLLWIARTFPEAPPALWRQPAAAMEEEQVRDHPVLRLLQRPNPFFTGPTLWMATITDWSVDGNAYWLKLREKGTGIVRQLWYAPSWMVQPRGSGSTFISHYEYRPGNGGPVDIDPADIVHFRFGIDSEDNRKGYSPLKSVLGEVFTDDEAARFTASLLRNMGVPGLVISPDTEASIDPVEAERTKAFLMDKFTGDRRGEPLVMSGKTKIQQFGFSPEQLLLRELRRIPEERVSAVLGVPAIVAGLGAGLERSTFTNMGEAREMAYESNIIPTQRIIAEEVRFQLLPEFEVDDALWEMRFGFDLAKVRVLQEDEDKRWRRFDMAVRGGWSTVAAAKRATGQEVLAGDDIYIRPMNAVQVPAGGGDPVPLTDGKHANGNGGPDSAELARAVVREMALTG